MSLEHLPTPKSKKMLKNDRSYQKDTGANLKRPTLVKTGITGIEINNPEDKQIHEYMLT